MDFDTVIANRRTCRNYKKKDLSLEAVAKVLECARTAPSSANVQNWQFVIVQDADQREKLADVCREQVWMADAPIHIVLCNKEKDVEKKFSSKAKEFAIQNCAMAAAFIVLKAEEQGLGCAVVGAFDPEAVRRVIQAPDDVIPECVITLGYAESVDEDQPREEVKYVTWLEKWGGKEVTKDIWPISKYGDQASEKIKQAGNRAKTKAAGVLRKLKK